MTNEDPHVPPRNEETQRPLLKADSSVQLPHWSVHIRCDLLIVRQVAQAFASAKGIMPLNNLRSRVKERLHHRNKAAWAQGQDTEVDDTLSYMSDESLTLTAVSGAPLVSQCCAERLHRQSATELLSAG